MAVDKSKMIEDEVRKFCTEARSILGVESFEFYIDVKEKPDPKTEHEVGTGDEEGELAATIQVSHAYLRAKITIFRSMYDTMPIDIRRRVIFHELSHIVVDPLVHLLMRSQNGQLVAQAEVTKAMEQTTELFSRLAYKIYERA